MYHDICKSHFRYLFSSFNLYSLHLMRLKLAFALAVEQCLQSFRIKMVKIRRIWKNYLPKRLIAIWLYLYLSLLLNNGNTLVKMATCKRFNSYNSKSFRVTKIYVTFIHHKITWVIWQLDMPAFLYFMTMFIVSPFKQIFSVFANDITWWSVSKKFRQL